MDGQNCQEKARHIRACRLALGRHCRHCGRPVGAGGFRVVHAGLVCQECDRAQRRRYALDPRFLEEVLS